MKKDAITLTFHPYTYVRVNVMKAKLIKKLEYDRLMKMGFAEIAKYLSDSEYKEEINKLGLTYTGAELLDMALTKNIEKTYQKIKRIADEDLKEVLTHYLRRMDIHNIKVVLRGIFTQTPEEEIKKLFMLAGSLPEELLLKLFALGSVEKVVDALPYISKNNKKTMKAEYQKRNSLFVIENELDKYYYQEISELIERIRGQGNIVRKFMENEIMIKNILTIVQLRKEGYKQEDIEKMLIKTKNSALNHCALSCLKAKEVEQIKNVSFGNKELKESVKEGLKAYKESGSMINLERALKTFLLKKARLATHTNMLSVDTILGFIFAKEIEIKNLQTIVRSKHLDVDETFMREQLII